MLRKIALTAATVAVISAVSAGTASATTTTTTVVTRGNYGQCHVISAYDAQIRPTLTAGPATVDATGALHLANGVFLVGWGYCNKP